MTLNHENSGGMFDTQRRRLQHFTLELNPKSGCYMVKDDRSGQIVGAGFATPDAAVKAYQAEDYRRTVGYSIEPTAVGNQLVIPGCEARRCAPGRAAPSLTLWDAANREGSE